MSKERENLVRQIDLLETQLTDDKKKKSRLTGTRGMLRRLNGDAEDVDKDQLSHDLTKLKQKLVDRKVHYGTVAMQRALKQALKMESLKLQRRKQKDEAGEKSNLQQEVQALQELDQKEVASVLTLRQLKKNYMKTKRFRETPPEFLSSTLVKQILDETREFTTVENNIIARVCKTAAVQTASTQLIQSIDNAARPDVVKKNAKKLRKEEVKAKKLAAAESTSEPTLSKNSSDDDDDNDDGDNDDSDEQEQDRPQPKARNDPFLADLPDVGYISGSDDEADRDNLTKELTTERKNRRGQRARRKIWEQKYGHKANHVQKDKKEQEAKKERKAQKEARKAQMERQRSEEKKKFDSAPIHPSWQAKKTQQVSAKPFQGKKIVF